MQACVIKIKGVIIQWIIQSVLDIDPMLSGLKILAFKFSLFNTNVSLIIFCNILIKFITFATMLHLKIKNKLKKSGLAITKHRSKVLGVMFRLAKPSSLKDIRSSLGLMDRVTVFRILNLFEKNNIIHFISLQDIQKQITIFERKN